MELPKLQKPDKYVGLYIFDFGDHAGVGFTAQEVAELLESEKYRHGKVYKIHEAYPDGKLELKGIRAETFQLEAGMFFYSADLETARKDFKTLVDLAVKIAPPCRAKVHLTSICCGKPKATMSPLRKQGSIAKKLDSRFRGNDKIPFPQQDVTKYNDDKFAVALIYPAEYDDEVSSWLLDGDYKTSGAAEGGAGAVQRYYDSAAEILDRHQLFVKSESISRTGEELLASLKLAVQR